MITKEAYEKLRIEYGKRASWAVWSMPDKGPKSRTSDLSVLSFPDICEKLNNEYVLIALNRAVHASNAAAADWSNFHSADNRRQNDYKLRYALAGTSLWGSYITDVLEIEEADSSNVMRKAQDDKQWVKENIARLQHELDLLGGHPKLVAIGNDAEQILRQYLGTEYSILKIPHFASRAANNKDNYRALIADVLSL